MSYKIEAHKREVKLYQVKSQKLNILACLNKSNGLSNNGFSIDLNMSKIDRILECRLPSLKTASFRSNTAKLRDIGLHQDSMQLEKSFYINPLQAKNTSFDTNSKDLNLSQICHLLLKEQNELKAKLSQQTKLIRQIYRSRPPSDSSNLNQINKENHEVTFKPEQWPQSAKSKRLKFPREIFTRKVKTRQS